MKLSSNITAVLKSIFSILFIIGGYMGGKYLVSSILNPSDDLPLAFEHNEELRDLAEGINSNVKKANSVEESLQAVVEQVKESAPILLEEGVSLIDAEIKPANTLNYIYEVNDTIKDYLPPNKTIKETIDLGRDVLFENAHKNMKGLFKAGVTANWIYRDIRGKEITRQTMTPEEFRNFTPASVEDRLKIIAEQEKSNIPYEIDGMIVTGFDAGPGRLITMFLKITEDFSVLNENEKKQFSGEVREVFVTAIKTQPSFIYFTQNNVEIKIRLYDLNENIIFETSIIPNELD